MTEAIRKQLAAHGAKLPPKAQRPPTTPRTASRPHQEAPKPPASRREPLTGPDETPAPSLAAQHYIGPYHLQVACGTHYPGRVRAVLTGPTDEALLRAVLAAIELHCFTQKA